MIKSITGHFKYYFRQIILQVAGSGVPRNGAGDRDERGFERRYFLPGKWRVVPLRDCPPASPQRVWGCGHGGTVAGTAASQQKGALKVVLTKNILVCHFGPLL